MLAMVVRMPSVARARSLMETLAHDLSLPATYLSSLLEHRYLHA